MTDSEMLAALNAPARLDHSTANLETAMCLWEAALELRDQLPALSAEWEEHGTVAMRHRVISLVDACEAEWNAARDAGTELAPYDWEHVPAFLIARFGPVVPASVSDLPAAASELLGLVEDALTVHIYSDDDPIPANCGYVASINRVRAALSMPAAEVEVVPVWSYFARFADSKGEPASYSTEVVAWSTDDALARGESDLLAGRRGVSKIDATVRLMAGMPR